MVKPKESDVAGLAVKGTAAGLAGKDNMPPDHEDKPEETGKKVQKIDLDSKNHRISLENHVVVVVVAASTTSLCSD